MMNRENGSKSEIMDQNELEQVHQEKSFIQNWLTDLLDAVENLLDREQQIRLFEMCGQGCYKRFSFKQELALQGNGSLESLINAYQQYFEIWQADDGVHIRYGKTSPGCYCPAARFRPPGSRDLHCECTRMTHQVIFTTALKKPVEIAIVETLRRGGTTCHFIAHLK
jgi:hypothetical protein